MLMTSIAIEENNTPPLLNALGRNIIPVPTKAFMRVKNVFVVPASPFRIALEGFLLPRSGLLSSTLSPCTAS
jgi:hypothetical protein